MTGFFEFEKGDVRLRADFNVFFRLQCDLSILL